MAGDGQGVYMSLCQHEDFECHAAIGRLSLVDGGPITHYCADIKVNCRQCGKPFEFVGLPLGTSAYRPAVSMDGLELHAPLMPEGMQPPEGLVGFSVRISETQQ
jgi:hypothetical protein